MYNTSNRQHILTQSTGTVWNFFYDEKLGICYSNLTKRNNWANPVSLVKNAYKTFYADIDQDDKFHLLFQDAQGNIIYSRLESESIVNIPVLNSKIPSVYDKHLRIIPLKNNIHFFYVLQHENSPFLAYQTLSDGKISNPKVIDYVTASTIPYSIVCDKASNIYAFYQSSDGKNLQLGFKKYNPVQKYWSEFTPVTKYEGNCENPKLVIDSKDILHLCYQRQNQRQYEMVYLQKTPEKNLWSNESIVHSSAHPFDNSSILCVNDDVIIYWIREDAIFYNTGSQSGSVWGKPSRYSFPVSRQLMCMHYSTNNTLEAGRIAVQDIPGCFIGGLKTAFYQPQSEPAENHSAEDLKNLLLESLKLLKASVEELKEGELEIRDEINKINTAQQELEKDLVKNNVKLNYLESQLNQVKALGNRLDAISSEIKNLKDKYSDVPP